MIRDLFEIAASYIQYLMLLFQIAETAFPDFFTSPVDVLQYVNLDLLNVFTESRRYNNVLNVDLPVWIPLDYRLQFAVVSVLGPLLIAVVGMFFLGTKPFFTWFVLLLGGVFVLIIASASKIEPDLVRETIIGRESVAIAWYVGLSITGAAVASGVALLLWRLMTQKEIEEQEQRELAEVVDAENNDAAERAIEIEMERQNADDATYHRRNSAAGAAASGADHMNQARNGGENDDPSAPSSPIQHASRKERLDHIMQLETAHIDVVATIARATYFVLFLGVGLIFARVISLSVFDPIQSNDLFYALSGIVMFVAAVMLVWLVVGLFQEGREFQFNLSVWVRDNFVSMLLLLLSVIYTPAITNIISIFSCEPVTCVAGYHLPIAMSVMQTPTVARYSSVTGSTACFRCNFTEFSPQQCPASFQDLLCGSAVTESRLSADVGVPCSDVGSFFITSAAVMLASFVVTLPMLYFILTNQSTKTVDLEFPLDVRQIEGFTEEERYNEKVHVSDNVAKFIYDPFTRQYQQWRMLVLGQKIVLVIVTVIARGEGSNEALRSGGIGIGATLAVHMLYLGYVMQSTPFQRKVENIFTASTEAILCAVSGAGLAQSLGVAVPHGVWVTVAVFVVAGPIVALIIGAVLTFKDDVLREQQREERVRMAQQTAEESGADSPTDTVAGAGVRMDGIGPTAAAGTESTGTVRRKQLHPPADASAAPSSGDPTPSTDPSSDGHGPRPTVGGASRSSGMSKGVSRAHIEVAARQRRVLAAHPRPKLDVPTEYSQRMATIDGSHAPLERFKALAAPDELDAIGRPTLISKLRKRYQVAGDSGGGSVGLLNKSSMLSRVGSFGSSTTLAVSGAKKSGGAFGAASANMLRDVRRNTAAESARARDNWAKAKLVVMAQINEERQASDMSAKRGRQKSFFVGGNATKRIDKLRGKGKQWDQFLVSLLVPSAGSALAAPDGSSPAASTSASPAGVAPLPDSTTSPAKDKTAGIKPLVAENLQIGFDPLQRAKEKKRARAKARDDALQASEAAAAQSNESSPLHASGANVLSPARSIASNDVLSPGRSSTMSDEDIEDQFRSIKGGAAGRRQHILLRLKLQTIYEKQLKRLQLTQQAVDFRINKDTILVLNRFFVFLGLFALVALACATIGAISNANEDFFTGVKFNQDMSTANQFVGYHSWSNFTAHCCCVGQQGQSPEWPYYVVDVEEWLCENGNVKERVRKAFIDGVLASGYGVRSLCNTTFANGCTAAVGPTGVVNITGCSTPGTPTASDKMLW